ncbi:hypothetical protein B0H66DRAFT_595100 [Apodospora peruviana]|uniref:Nephrocystin 3-like N-terminal domain-containing protein n=1 Tax=Apodospora peruviana TaxID=516989 RepID=A0AAE0HWV2_9PEZI|nr:hypothetical protein B0H66DRAFT_595100 [Apodospora peruviana]
MIFVDEPLYPNGNTPDWVLPTFDIVLVHGLDGDPIATWQADDAERTVWPRDLLPNHFPNIRVLSFGYNASIKGTTSQSGIRDHARALLQWLDDFRDGESELSRPLIFVGHSLGGVLIKQALLFAFNEGQLFGPILESTYGIVCPSFLLSFDDTPLSLMLVVNKMFFATPHYGMDNNDWERLVSHVVTHHGYEGATGPTNKMLAEIRANCHILTDVTEDFRPLLDRNLFSIVNFLEDNISEVLGDVVVNKVTGRLGSHPERRLSGDHIGLCKFAAEDTLQFRAVVKELRRLMNDSQKAQYISKIHREVLSSLCTVDFHRYSLQIRPTKGTCHWIEKQLNIHDQGTKPLWIHGRPACGKTYLAKYIIHKLRTTKHDVMECFLNCELEERRDCHAILRSTIHQVARSNSGLIDKFLLREYEETKLQPVIWGTKTLGNLWPAVMAETVKHHKLTMVIDGFDELTDRDQEAFISCFAQFEELAQRRRKNLRLVILSRPCSSLHLHRADFETIDLDTQDNSGDIYLTVEEKLARFAGPMNYSASIKREVCRKVTKGAKGMYLWAAVMIADLEDRLLNEWELKQQLETLPRELAELYDSILGRISAKRNGQGQIVKMILRWVTFRQEKLRIPELGVGLALARHRKDHPTIAVTDSLLRRYKAPPPSIKPWIFRLCGQLVRFSRDNVQPLHRSLSQYLTTPTAELRRDHPDWRIPHHSKFYLPIEESHAVLGSLCVSYLTMSYFENSGAPFQPTVDGRAVWVNKVRARMGNHEFARYSALCWSKHLKEAGSVTTSREVDEEGKMILENEETHHAICWSEIWWLKRRWPALDFPVRDLEIGNIIFHTPPSTISPVRDITPPPVRQPPTPNLRHDIGGHATPTDTVGPMPQPGSTTAGPSLRGGLSSPLRSLPPTPSQNQPQPARDGLTIHPYQGPVARFPDAYLDRRNNTHTDTPQSIEEKADKIEQIASYSPSSGQPRMARYDQPPKAKHENRSSVTAKNSSGRVRHQTTTGHVEETPKGSSCCCCCM